MLGNCQLRVKQKINSTQKHSPLLPNGEHFIISVFVSESKEDIDTNEKIIADIAKAAYDFYTATEK